MVSVQQAQVDDPRAQRLLRDYFRMRAETFPAGQTYQPAFPTPATFTPPAGVFLLVIDDDGGAIGCGGIRRIEDGPAGIRYEIKHVYLTPAARGKGSGRLLLDALEAAARTWEAAELVLDTHHTLVAAGNLYARSGFVTTEAYNDNPNATRWYRKALDES